MELTSQMAVLVNGAEATVADGTTLADLVHTHLGTDPRACAAAVDGEVVPRSGWSDRVLAPGNRVEIVTAVPGG